MKRRCVWAPGLLAIGAAVFSPPCAAQSAEETLDIGAVDGPVHEIFENIVTVEVAGDGSILVLDAGDGSIRVFDTSGRFVTRFGGRGEGPAEFAHIGASALVGDTLVVLDRNVAKLVSFSLGGELLETRRTSFSVGAHGFPIRMHAVSGGGLLLEGATGCSVPRREGRDTQWHLVLIPREGPDPVELRREDHGRSLAVYGTDGGTFCGVLPLPFEAGPVVAARADGVVAFGLGDSAEVRFFQVAESGPAGRAALQGPPLQVLRVPGTATPLARADRTWWERTVLARRTGPDAPAPVAERFREAGREIVFPATWPAYDRMVFDAEGELWVRRPPPGDAVEAAWDVIRRDRSHRGTVALPAALEVHRIVADAVYGVMKGAWDEDRVKRFKVRWG